MKYFKTDGIRGVFGKDDLSVELLLKIGYSFDIFKEKNILIGYDTRYSSKIILNTLKYSLRLCGKNVIDYGLMSTPCMHYLSRKKNTVGIMITASHNDYTYNGIKIILKGDKLSDEDKYCLEKRMEENHKAYKIGLEKMRKIPKSYYSHFNRIKTNNKLKIVFDLANGSMTFLKEYLEKRFLNAIFINTEPNGFNINHECGSLYPELARKIMIENDYDIAVSFDGDGDRAIIIYKNGKILNGDLMLYFFALEYKRRGILKNDKVIYSIIANRGITKELEENGIDVIFTDVGDQNISKMIKKGISNLGGEKSGHIILNKKMNYSCGLTTFLYFLSFLNDEAIIKMNSINEYYEISKNIDKLDNPSKLKDELKKTLINGYVNVRKSGTENVYRIVCMSQNKEEIQDSLRIIKNHEANNIS